MRNGNCIIKDEKKGIEFDFKMLPVDVLEIPEIQRNLSKSLVQKLVISIDKAGFIVPIVVEFNEQTGKYDVIDGQHRYEAALSLGYTKIPAIIAPKGYRDLMLTFNIEKPSNLRDKAHQVYMLYKEKIETAPNSTEIELSDIFEAPYYITVGIVIEEFNPKFSGYHFEQVLKKIDNKFLDLELPEAYNERRKMAKILNRANEVLNERYNELGLNNALLKRELVTKAFQNIYGKRVRKIDDDYYIAMNKLINELKKVDLVDLEDETSSIEF